MHLELAQSIGKASWQPLLQYVAQLHRRSVHPATAPFPHPWEEIGPGYHYGPAFGHWDIVHAILDILPEDPVHAERQLGNNLALQQEDGLIPGSVWMRKDGPKWSRTHGHPPVWPYAAEEILKLLGPVKLPIYFDALVRQLQWFEDHRRAEPEGFFYTDILDHQWESGVDEGIRFLDVQTGPRACIDATSHVCALLRFAITWGNRLGRDVSTFEAKFRVLERFIQEDLYDAEVGFFFDHWAKEDPSLRCFTFEGMWPVVMGLATPSQAQRVIHDHLLNPRRFFTEHPLATVSVEDPRFELRMWRGPAWNSMTYWAARGCLYYGEVDAARQLLERVLDQSAKHFAETGTIWEFYHPHGGSPTEVQRKPHTEFNTPFQDYLGHNPLRAMARLWAE